MPARSEAQQAYLNAKFGHAWTKRHHFDNKRRLPAKKGNNVAKDKRVELISAFMKKGKPPRFPSPHGQATTRPGKLSGGDMPTEDYPFAKGRPGKRITEDDPRWNPRTMGNKRGNSAGYYRKGRGRPD